MPTIYFVQQAQKENPVAKVGEPYYWWRFLNGHRYYSKTKPDPRMLTQSEFRGRAYALNAQIMALDPESVDELRQELQTIADAFRTLGDEQRAEIDSMPNRLTDTTETPGRLQQRYDDCCDIAEALEGVDLSRCYDNEETFREVLEEIQTIHYSGE